MTGKDLKDFLDEKVDCYNSPSFILEDPIQIPHRFSKKEDREIIGFLSSIIAWGQRKTIIRNADRLFQLMENSPHEYLLNSSNEDHERFSSFVHRTFNGIDCMFFISRLSQLYSHHGGLEHTLGTAVKESGTVQGISEFKALFFSTKHEQRSQKHLADPMRGSSAKRINMFLRWMVRADMSGVDFGLWKNVPMSQLSVPLDVHTGNVARALGLLKRKQNDQKSVQELDLALRELDPIDPVKYDFALFGLGVYEGFGSK